VPAFAGGLAVLVLGVFIAMRLTVPSDNLTVAGQPKDAQQAPMTRALPETAAKADSAKNALHNAAPATADGEVESTTPAPQRMKPYGAKEVTVGNGAAQPTPPARPVVIAEAPAQGGEAVDHVSEPFAPASPSDVTDHTVRGEGFAEERTAVADIPNPMPESKAVAAAPPMMAKTRSADAVAPTGESSTTVKRSSPAGPAGPTDSLAGGQGGVSVTKSADQEGLQYDRRADAVATPMLPVRVTASSNAKRHAVNIQVTQPDAVLSTGYVVPSHLANAADQQAKAGQGSTLVVPALREGVVLRLSVQQASTTEQMLLIIPALGRQRDKTSLESQNNTLLQPLRQLADAGAVYLLLPEPLSRQESTVAIKDRPPLDILQHLATVHEHRLSRSGQVVTLTPTR
jgi:hypothetical protein